MSDIFLITEADVLAQIDDADEMMAWRNEGEEYEPSDSSDDRQALINCMYMTHTAS
jgi:hypothetical protein